MAVGEANGIPCAAINDVAVWERDNLDRVLERWQRVIGPGRGVRKWLPGSVQPVNEEAGNKGYLVEKGIVALTHERNDGRQVFVALRRPGEMFGCGNLFLGAGLYISACALTDVEVRVIDVQWLFEQIKKGGEAGLLVAHQHERDLTEKAAELRDVMHMDASVRFQRLLIQIAGVQQSGSTKDAAIDLPLTDSQIASLLGISAQQFSAVKRKLNRAGGAQYLKGRRAWIVSPSGAARGRN